VGDPQHRVLLRGAHHPRKRETGLTADPAGRAPVPLDGFVVPALLLLAARELHLHDPLRVLGWRLLHEEIRWPSWIAPFLPAPSAAVDRDPVALALTSLAMLVAIAYAASAPFLRLRWRAALLGLGAVVLVALPTIGLVTMGFASGRPYGQDGGVVQLPLAMDRLLSGDSPYGADYSDSMLGRQARVSAFWREYGGNPILRHHAYLPGTHLLMMPAYVACRALFGAFDTRFVTTAALVLTAALAFLFVRGGARGLTAAGLVLVNPLVWWHQVFGANDVMVAGLLLGAALFADRGRRAWAGALLGLACATKQLAWPYAPFLAVQLMGATSFRDLARRETWTRAARPLLAAAAVFLSVVLPVAALDPRAFWGDIVAYNIGLAGGDAYPLGGTPGFGLANLVIYFGAVGSLKDHVSFAPFYLLLVPLGLLMLRRQMREGGAATALVLGSVALVASLYVSRVVHPNYLVLAAILLPVGCLARRRDALLAVAPLSLLAIAVEYAQNEMLRTAWEQAAATGFLGVLSPRGWPHLTVDPLGALVSALVAGVAVLWLATAAIADRPRVQAALLGLGFTCAVVVPTALFVAVGSATGGPLRGQDAWLADVAYAGGPAAIDETHPPRVREAWSSSFRQEPPAALLPAGAWTPGALLGRALGAIGLRDPRPLLVLALLGAAILAARLHRAQALLAMAAVALSPALATGLAQGAPEALSLLALLAYLARLPGTRVVLPVVVVTTLLWLGRGSAPPPSLGLGGLLAYFGAEGSGTARSMLTPLALVALAFLPGRWPRWFAAGVAWVALLWMLGRSALWLGAPIALLALGAAQEPDAPAAAEA
jgi:hypothetical protein